METVKRIYKLAMAEFLIDNGCELVKTVDDLINPNRKNWLFKDDEKLRETMLKFNARKQMGD